jgi:peptide/nickel transport system permease protein
MTAYVIRKVAMIPLQLLAITMVIFALINLAPGDPVRALISPELPPSVAEARREQLGLNQPIPVRYVLWLRETVQGNLGFSYLDHQPVSGKIGSRLGPTILLMSAGLLVGILLAIPLGTLAALLPRSPVDYALTGIAFASVSVPTFFLGLVLIFALALGLRAFPVSGMFTVGAPSSLPDLLRHMALPVVVLAVQQFPIYMRLTRGSVLEVLRGDFIRTARAKGLPERLVIVRHGLRNGLLPIITRLGFGLSWIFVGAVITEQVFQWPGIGLLTVQALSTHDYPVLMAINLFAAILVISGNLLADVGYAFADPRIRY